jgi:hypothetical protein
LPATEDFVAGHQFSVLHSVQCCPPEDPYKMATAEGNEKVQSEGKEESRNGGKRKISPLRYLQVFSAALLALFSKAVFPRRKPPILV